MKSDRLEGVRTRFYYSFLTRQSDSNENTTCVIYKYLFVSFTGLLALFIISSGQIGNGWGFTVYVYKASFY
jgi:hypothetical protein